MRRALGVLMGLGLGAGVVVAQQASTPEVQLKAAMQRELVDGDVIGAVEQYKKIADQYATNHLIASKALLQLAECYDKLGRPEARLTFEQIVREYAETEAAKAARARLAAPANGQGASTQPMFDMHDLDLPQAFRLAPDGRSILYARPGAVASTVGAPLYVRNLATGLEHPIGGASCFSCGSGGAMDGAIGWSPDGRHVTAWQAAPTPIGTILVFDVQTGASRSLDDALVVEGSTTPAVSWSADSHHLAYVASASDDRHAEIRVLTIGSSQIARLETFAAARKTVGPPTRPITVLQTPPDLCWSPDSRRLLWHSVDISTSREEIRIATLASGEVTSLPLPPALSQGRLRTWTRRNDLVIRGPITPPAPTAVFVIPLGGGSSRQICEEPNSGRDACTIGLDGGAAIAWDPDKKKLIVIDVASGVSKLLTLGGAEESGAVVSPDGRLVSFWSNRDGRWAQYVAVTDRAPLAASPVRIATYDAAPFGAPAETRFWTADGRLIVRRGFVDSDIYRIDVDPSTGRATQAGYKITHDGATKAAPRISPDSRQVTYRISMNGCCTEGFVSADGTSARGVIEGPFASLWRSPSELVSATVIAANGPMFSMNVATRNIKTEAIRPASKLDTMFGMLQYIKSLDEVVYAQDARHLRARSIQSGADREFIEFSSPGPFGPVLLSPDGKYVAYQSVDSQPGKPIQMTGLRLASTDGAAVRVLAPRGFPAAWSPDGRLLLFGGGGGGPKIMNVGTGESWPFLVDGDPLRLTGDGEFADWSADGTFVVLGYGSTGARWHAWEGVTYDAIIKLMNRRGR